MAELSGTLEGIGLLPVLHFVLGLRQSGRLSIADEPFSGTLSLEQGRLIGATFGEETGVAALEAIGLVLGKGRFTFTVGGERHLNLTLERPAVEDRLCRLAAEGERLARAIPSFSAVPILALDDNQRQEPVMLERGALRLLVRLRGSMTVAELARQHGLLPTLRGLTRLVELGLVRLQAPVERHPWRIPTRPAPVAAPQPAAAVHAAHVSEPGSARWAQWRRAGRA